MRCHKRECTNEATHVRDIPTIGEALCFCKDCVANEIVEYKEDFGWKVMTPERLKEEENYEETTLAEVRARRMALSNFWSGKK